MKKTAFKQFSVTWLTTRGNFATRNFATKKEAKRFQDKHEGHLHDKLFGCTP